MSNAIESQGFKFEIGSVDSPSVWTEVKEVNSFSGFDGHAAEIDTTHLQSTAKEFLMGLQDFGSFNMDLNHLPTDPGQIAMRAAKASRVLQDFRVTFSSGAKAYFSGFVLSNPISGKVDDKVDGSLAIRISGSVQFT